MLSIVRFRDWPLAVKLIVSFLVVALAPLAIVIFVTQVQSRAGLLAEAQRTIGNVSHSSGDAINAAIERREATVQNIHVQDDVRTFIYTAINDRVELRPDFVPQRNSLQVLQANATGQGDYVFLVSAVKDSTGAYNGNVEITSSADGTVPNGQPVNVSDASGMNGVPASTFAQYQKAFTAAINREDYISAPFIVSHTGDTVSAAMIYASAIYPPENAGTIGNNDPIGVVMSVVSMSEIWNIVTGDNLAAGPGSFTMLVDPSGVRVADSRAPRKGSLKYLFNTVKTLSPDETKALAASKRLLDISAPTADAIPGAFESFANASNDTTQRLFSTNIADGAAEGVSTRLSGPAPWLYFVVVPNSTFEAAANDIARISAILFVIAALLIILTALIVTRLLTRPVRDIRRVLGQIGMGDFDARVNVRSRDELGVLGDNLNAMFDNTLTLIQTREEKDALQDDIMKLLEEISIVADGDLTVQAEVTTSITGNIADAFNQMIEELRKVITNIQYSTAETNIVLEQLLRGTQRSDEAAERQARQIATVSASVGDVNRAGREVAEAAADSADVAQIARQTARQGGAAVGQTIDGMNRIRANVQETSKKVKRLAESSQQIGEIVKLIDDIADQTKMLALNAAIQAAMAGEQGKGFTVVAEEVRRLAERAATATGDIAGLVKSIQDDTAEAVVSMEETTREVVDGSGVADDAGRALQSIESVVARLADLILGISHLSQNQAITTNEIAGAMDEIGRLTQEATQIRRVSAVATQKLARTATGLRSSVSAFRIVDASAPTFTPFNTSDDTLDAAPTYASLGAGAADGGGDDLLADTAPLAGPGHAPIG